MWAVRSTSARRLLSVTALLAVFSLLGLSPTQALQGGEDATGDNLVNTVYSRTFAPAGCSASLIHPRIAVTAAHCLGLAYRISAPGQDLKRQVETGRELPGQALVVDYVTPRGYVYPCSREDDTCLNSDIALLILDSPLPFNSSVRVATMDEIQEWVETKSPGVIYGYGQTAEGSPLPYRPFKSTWYPVRAQGTVMMAETREPNVTTCPGDSGGPLYFRKGSEILFVGPHFTKRHDRSPDSQVVRRCGFFSDGTSPWSTHTMLAAFPELMQQALIKVSERETAEAKQKEAQDQKAKKESAKKPKKPKKPPKRTDQRVNR